VQLKKTGMKKIAALVKLTRPVNVIITFAAVSVGYIISSINSISTYSLVAAGVSGALTAGAGNIVNDIFDMETDKINHPRRPLAAGIISYKAAKWLWFFFTLISLSAASLINFYAPAIVLSVHIILIFYSFRFKSATFAGNFIVAALTSLAFIYGGFAAGNLERIIIPAVFAFLINYPRELVKDMQDVKGDKIAGVVTFPVKYGYGKTRVFILVLVTLLILFSLYPFFTEYYKIEFFIIMMIIVNPVMVYILKMLWTGKDDRIFSRISSLLKFNMAAGLIAIWFGQ